MKQRSPLENEENFKSNKQFSSPTRITLCAFHVDLCRLFSVCGKTTPEEGPSLCFRFMREPATWDPVFSTLVDSRTMMGTGSLGSTVATALMWVFPLVLYYHLQELPGKHTRCDGSQKPCNWPLTLPNCATISKVYKKVFLLARFAFSDFHAFI